MCRGRGFGIQYCHTYLLYPTFGAVGSGVLAKIPVWVSVPRPLTHTFTV